MIQLTNMSGRLSSPNFPSNYPGNVQCGWNISIPAGYKIYLTFLEFDLEECGSSCTCDYVEVSLFITLIFSAAIFLFNFDRDVMLVKPIAASCAY